MGYSISQLGLRIVHSEVAHRRSGRNMATESLTLSEKLIWPKPTGGTFCSLELLPICSLNAALSEWRDPSGTVVHIPITLQTSMGVNRETMAVAHHRGY